MPKRRKDDFENTAVRRSTNACHRCKNKKIKCYFSNASLQSTCVSCFKSRTDCVFDVTPDGIPRGAEYVASLESRIVDLEERLRSASQGQSAAGSLDTRNDLLQMQDSLSGVFAHSDGAYMEDRPSTTRIRHDRDTTLASFNSLDSQGMMSTSVTSPTTANSPARTQHKVIESGSDGVTIFNFLSIQPDIPESENSTLPELPSERFANSFLETTYTYTQGRYCLVDWVQVRRWHQHRASIWHAARLNDPEAHTGAYFIWMVYAIGAQLTPSPPNSPAGYYTRALEHLPAILCHQNLTSLQALLIMIQYFYRSPGGPSIWHLAGAAMRLCVELGLHRKATMITGTIDPDPYRTELKKRLFWCAYCFDRSVSILSKRPFGIQDADIDVELPVDIDVMCLDGDELQERQALQESGDAGSGAAHMSTITVSLHHLRMYRLQSRIMSRFAGIHALPPTPEGILSFLKELSYWRERASHNNYPLTSPQQTYESVQASYYMTALLLLRPILARPSMDGELLKRCAVLSADACENEKTLCFSPQNHNSPVRIYNCFRCGLTLLQCLAIHPTILPVRSALRAINSCSSALSVYTGALAVARSYLRLFDKLSDYFFGYDTDGALCRPDDNLRGLLQRVTSCDPSDIPDLLKSLSAEENSRQIPVQTPAEPLDDGSAPAGTDPAPTFGMDLIPPLEILDDSLRPDLFQENMMGFWSGSFGL